jgi:hypothetical protein
VEKELPFVGSEFAAGPGGKRFSTKSETPDSKMSVAAGRKIREIQEVLSPKQGTKNLRHKS